MIHYHGTPMGGQREQAEKFLRGRHALVPFPRPEDIGTVAAVCRSFCLDNGAFTAWKQGEPITDWRPYFEWVRDWCHHPAFDFAILPDVIDGSELDNDQLICDMANWKGWKWGDWHHKACDRFAPVWHLHESIDRLKRLARGWRLVCLGSSGECATPGTENWWERMSEAMDAICVDGRPVCKLHGLRMLSPDIFTRLPLSSADSTNVAQNASLLPRFGSYKSPNLSTRMNMIADCIESRQSAAEWVKRDIQMELFMGMEL